MVKITTICGQDAFVKIPEPEDETEATLWTTETEKLHSKIKQIPHPRPGWHTAASTVLPWTYSFSSGSKTAQDAHLDSPLL